MHSKSLVFFLAAFAAFGLAFGADKAMAAQETSALESVFGTPAGKAALAKTGVDAAKLGAMIQKLTPEQRTRVESLLKQASPENVLVARMIESGYTPAEAAKRLAVMSNDEIASLAGNPESTATGGSAFIALLIIIIVALIIILYYQNEPTDEYTPPSPPPSR